MTFWKIILILIKSESSLARNIIGQTLEKNVKTYLKHFNVCLTLKANKHKFYGNFKALLISIY